MTIIHTLATTLKESHAQNQSQVMRLVGVADHIDHEWVLRLTVLPP